MRYGTLLEGFVNNSKDNRSLRILKGQREAAQEGFKQGKIMSVPTKSGEKVRGGPSRG